MKHIKNVEVPAHTRKVVDFVTCDLCGGVIKTYRYEVDEVEIMHRTGDEFPEGGSGEETTVDMCGECFDTKLLPWLLEQGAKPETKEWSR
jgi:hypothetical protein